jgi:hypothetical protein
LGLLDKLFGSAADRTKAKLLDIAGRLHIESPRASVNQDETGTLKAEWLAAELHLWLGDGTVLECELSHAYLPGELDLEYIYEKRKEAIVPLPPVRAGGEEEDDDDDENDDDDDDEVVSGQAHVGGGLFCGLAQLESFAKLPAPLRARIADELRAAGVSTLRVGNTYCTLQFVNDTDSSTGPSHVVRALSLAMEICKVRGLPAVKAPEGETITPQGLASKFANHLPGSTVEDLGGTGGIWARATFVHEGVSTRLAFYRYDEITCNVWLEVRAEGKLGAFSLVKGEGDEPPAQANGDKEERLYLSRHCYVQSERSRSEAARVLSLPMGARDRLFDLCERGDAIVLDEQVLSMNLGDIFFFMKKTEETRGPVVFPVAEAAELAAVARALPVLSAQLVELAEARTCRYCAAIYVFSPESLNCARCGAAPTA